MQKFQFESKKYLHLDLSSSKQSRNLKKVGKIVILVAMVISAGFYFQSYKNQLYQQETTDIGKPMESVKNAYQGILDRSEKSGYNLTVEGLNLVEKGKTDLGIMALEAATRKDPNYRDGFIFAGHAYLQLTTKSNDRTQLEKAKFYLEKAKDLDPIYSLTYKLLAETYSQLGDAENAALCYNKAKDFAIK